MPFNLYTMPIISMPMNLIAYWGYIIIIFILSFMPGFIIASRFKSLNFTEQLATSFGFSFVILTLMVPFFALKLNSPAQLLFTGIIIASLLYLFKKKSEFKFDTEIRFVLLIFLIGLVSKFFLQTLWEYPVMGGDWFGHAFVRPYGFETGNWLPDRDRTPLFSLLIYAYHNLLGISLYQYWVSQIISVVINSAFILPAYLIAKKAFGDRVAKVSALFMLVTPFLIFNTLYTWPKNAAMYGILMMIYFLFFSKHDAKLRYPLAGFFAGIGFLFHNYAVLYIGIAVLILIYKEKMYRGLLSKKGFNNLKRLSYFLIVLLIILAPYFAWVHSYYGTILTTKLIYYPFAVNGYDTAISGNRHELFNTFYSTPIKELIMIRVTNAVITLTPTALPIDPIATAFRTYNPIYYYTHDYPGALSTLMYLLVVIWFIRYILGKTKTDSVMVSFLVLPVIMSLILFGWRDWGLVTGLLQPTIPLLIIIGFNEVFNWGNEIKYKLVYIVFISAVIENVVYGVLISRFYQEVEGGLQNVAKMGKMVTPDFQISNFVSAHFLLNGNINMMAGFLISIGIIILAYILLYDQGRLDKSGL